MITQFQKASVAVEFNVFGEEKMRNQTFSDVRENATGETMLEFGNTLKKLTTEDTILNAVVHTKAIRYLN